MKPLHRRYPQAALFAAGLAGILAMAACAAAPARLQGKTAMRQSSAEVLMQARQNDPSLEKVMHDASGYAVFPSIGKGTAGTGGAYARGDVYQSGAVVGYCDMTQASESFQPGGKAYTEILVFETPAAV